MYASVVWNPYLDTQISKLERVQHKFLRFISYKLNTPMSRYNHDYSEILTSLNMRPLHVKRKIHDILFLYDIINNNFNCPEIVNQIRYSVPGKAIRNNSSTFHIPILKTSISRNSVIPRISAQGNNCHSTIDLFCMSKSQIKNNLFQLYVN